MLLTNIQIQPSDLVLIGPSTDGLIPLGRLLLVHIFKSNVCTLIILSGRTLQSCSLFMCTHAKYKLILERWVQIMLQSVNMRTFCVIKNINMLSFYAGESLSRKVPMKSGGAARYSLCFNFGCCSCATDKSWPESRLRVFILSFLLHVVWLWSKIIGLCSIYCLVSLDKRTSTWRGPSFSKGWSLQASPDEFEKNTSCWFYFKLLSEAPEVPFLLYKVSVIFCQFTGFCFFCRICHVAYREWWMQYIKISFQNN